MQKKKKKEKRVKNDIEEQERSRLCELRRELSKAAQEADLGVNAKAGNPEEKWQSVNRCLNRRRVLKCQRAQ